MKNLISLFAAVVIFTACNNVKNEEQKNNKVLWAESVLTILPLERDSLWSVEEWAAAYKYDKEKIFSSLTAAVLSGKLKAYNSYPGTAFTVKEFSEILLKWDTLLVEDPYKPGNLVPSITKSEQSAQSIVQLKFNEKIEMDTVAYSLNKKVSSVTFFVNKYNEEGEVLGLKKLFEVKLNE